MSCSSGTSTEPALFDVPLSSIDRLTRLHLRLGIEGCDCSNPNEWKGIRRLGDAQGSRICKWMCTHYFGGWSGFAMSKKRPCREFYRGACSDAVCPLDHSTNAIVVRNVPRTPL